MTGYSAYFDDSKAHGSSDLFLIGGLFGSSAQWAALEADWKAILNSPLNGEREPIKEFHAAECWARRKNFSGWSYAERDALFYEFRQVILKHHLYGYAHAISADIWDLTVPPSIKKSVGDPERACIANCALNALRWVNMQTDRADVAFVFDDRTPEVSIDSGKIFQVLKAFSEIQNIGVKPTSHSFCSSETVLPLQAADMVAWSMLQFARQLRGENVDDSVWPHINNLVSNGRIRLTYMGPEEINRMVENYGNDPNGVELSQLMGLIEGSN